ncbi:nitroreductase family protein [Paenibacillus oenotherae]|uniref:Nitroreductase family protein n=1 Tax=Paenibacillus oenotherae TaxID=1435645 RepID=A0ABS7DB14_9BACL|nr:nitroreductase family protein [Paenibacillus oenotherae]MBW7476348.1 nitroreductase family protein [Paenibacillus oenotherae]
MTQTVHNPGTSPEGLQYDAEASRERQPEYPVHPLFLNRWSPRSYSPDKILSDEVLYTVLEAARWAPSGGNQQPWRFYIARSPEERELFQRFIRPRNQLWTVNAPVLILIGSVTVRESGEPLNTHAFDTGAAWASIAFQANLLGLSTRAVGGFDQAAAREQLGVPEEIQLHAVLALGYRGDKQALDPEFHEQEKPNSRRPLEGSIIPIVRKD